MTNACGTSTISFTHTANEVVATLMATDITCNGEANGQISIAVSGGTAPYVYSIDGANFQASEIFTDLALGSYDVTTKDVNGCVSTAITTVFEPDKLTASAHATDALCNGEANGSITATVTGGTSPYEYSIDGATFQASSTLAELMAGDYTVTVKGANGCTATAITTISEPNQLTASAQATDGLCNGDANGSITVTASGGASPYEYSLDGATFQSSSTLSELMVGDYTVTVKDANGCISTTITTVSEPDELTASTQATDALCNGDANGNITATATGGASPYEYSLDGTTFQSSSTLSELMVGDYTITVKDANGCISTTITTVSEPDELTASTQATDALCNGDANGNITVQATGSISPYEYSIDGTTFQSSDSFSGLVAGSYPITIKDGNGCITTNSTAVAEPTVLSITSSFNGNAIDLTTLGGTSPYEYSVDSATFQTEANFTLPNGEYSFTVKDANECIATTQQSLFVTAVNQNFAKKEVAVYPNPVAYEIHISGLAENSQLTLIDNTGRIVLSKKTKDSSIVIDVAGLTKGVYLLKMTSEEGGTNNERVIIN